MDGLDLALEPAVQRHRAQDPLWARVSLVVGWSLVWVTGIVLATLFAWKVLVPWLVHA